MASTHWTPQRTLVPCPTCGHTVLRATWNGTLRRWLRLDPLQEPFSGAPHDCRAAQQRWDRLARWSAGDLDLLVEGPTRRWLDRATGEVLDDEQEASHA